MGSHAPQNIAEIDYGVEKKTFRAYAAGFFLSLMLTIMSFSLVMTKVVSSSYVIIGLAVLAVLQLLVQSYCFLRLNAKAENRWNTIPFLFSIFVIAVLVCGSIWIMYNLNYNMYH